MQLARTAIAGSFDRLAVAFDAFQRALVRVVHGRCQRHWRRQEGLHLIKAEVVLLQPDRQIHHVFLGRARVGRDEVRDQILLLARLLRGFLEHRLELVIGADARLHHVLEHIVLGVLGRDLQVAANVMGDQFLDVFR